MAVRKRTLPNGQVRWGYSVMIGYKPDGSKLQESSWKFRSYDDAVKAYNKIKHDLDEDRHVARWNGTISELVDEYFAAATFEKSPATVVSYRDALKPVREQLGRRKARDVKARDIERFRDQLLASGRRNGGGPLGARSVRLTLGQLKAAFELGIARGKLSVNPCKTVALPRYEREERPTWSKSEVQAYLAEASKHRLHFALRLAVRGLRRGEIAGLQWSDLDLGDAPSVAIRRTRILVDGRVVVKSPKSRKGTRTLALDPATAQAARDLLLVQMDEKDDAEKKMPAALRELGMSPYQDGGWVVADEFGVPLSPERISDLFESVSKAAKLPRIRLHDGRHTFITHMVQAGVNVADVSAYAGHATVAFTLTHYTHGEAASAGLAVSYEEVPSA